MDNNNPSSSDLRRDVSQDSDESEWPEAKPSSDLPPFPWFGCDIGGTLCKMVYFEPKNAPEATIKKGLKNIKHYLLSKTAYGGIGLRDAQLELKDVKMGGVMGNLHFIRFPTHAMATFMELVKTKKLTLQAQVISATGGGAIKFEKMFYDELQLTLDKHDELLCLMEGIDFIRRFKTINEFYTINFDGKKESYNFGTSKTTYPYLLVNIGSGVPFITVQSRTTFERVAGSHVGGGAFLGLACIICKVSSYEEAMELAKKGDPKKVDKLVGDIYGGGYAPLQLDADVLAASFGRMQDPKIMSQDDAPSKEDLCAALLKMVTLNIGTIAYLCAKQQKMNKVIFTGNYLRSNELSETLVCSAFQFWSSSSITPIFTERIGYLGCLGSLIKLLHQESTPSTPESTSVNDFQSSAFPSVTASTTDVGPATHCRGCQCSSTSKPQ